MERYSTGIMSLDSQLGGGFPAGSFIVLIEDPGAGANYFVYHFVIEGLRKGEKALFISTEETEEEIRNNVKAISGMNPDNLDILDLMSPKVFGMVGGGDAKSFLRATTQDPYKRVTDELWKSNHNRIAIHSLTYFVENYSWEEVKALVDKITIQTRRNKSVCVATFTKGMFESRIEAAIKHYADGVIELSIREAETEVQRRLKVIKIKATIVPKSILRYDITEKGIRMESVMRVL